MTANNDRNRLPKQSVSYKDKTRPHDAFNSADYGTEVDPENLTALIKADFGPDGTVSPRPEDDEAGSY